MAARIAMMCALVEALLDLAAAMRAGLRRFDSSCWCFKELPASFHDFVGNFLEQRRTGCVHDFSVQAALLRDILTRLFHGFGRRAAHVLDVQFFGSKDGATLGNLRCQYGRVDDVRISAAPMASVPGGGQA